MSRHKKECNAKGDKPCTNEICTCDCHKRAWTKKKRTHRKRMNEIIRKNKPLKIIVSPSYKQKMKKKKAEKRKKSKKSASMIRVIIEIPRTSKR